MKQKLKETPRVFGVNEVFIKDYGEIELEACEMVTLVTTSQKKCDITFTEWGLYLGSSINGRMSNEGFKVALVKNPQGKFFLNAVEQDKVQSFLDYLESQQSELVQWF